jgi:hypothetical protein
VIPFQNCVRQFRPPTNMVAVTKNKKGGWNLKYLHLWNVWSQVAKWFQRRIFLVIVYGRTTDAKWWQRLTLWVRWAKIPFKLLGQLDSSFAKIILWWSPFNVLSDSPVLGPKWTMLLFINDSLHSK